MTSRRVPPLHGLRAFEAAARHLSFSRAADELCVTPGAVSRQVAKLEGHLGVVVAQYAFVEDDLDSRRLVAPFPLIVPRERAYYLVYPPERKNKRKIASFREWLLETASSK